MNISDFGGWLAVVVTIGGGGAAIYTYEKRLQELEQKVQILLTVPSGTAKETTDADAGTTATTRATSSMEAACAEIAKKWSDAIAAGYVVTMAPYLENQFKIMNCAP